MKSWYRITNRADTTAEVFLYDEVGAWGTSAGDFAKELKDVKASEITLRLNSPGGEVFDGLAIYSALKRHPAKVTVHVDGLAASITSVIAMAGDRILIDRHAQMMIHEAHAIAVGNTKDMTAMARLLDEYSDNIASIYAERAGGDVATWRDRMRSESWFSAKEAVSAGLADEVAAGPAPREMTANTWDLSIFNYAGRDKAPNPLGTGWSAVGERGPELVRPLSNIAPAPPPAEPTSNPPDEAGFLMPALDLARIRDAVESLDEIPLTRGLITAAVSLGANDCPAPDAPAPPVPAPPGPDLSINLPGLRRAIREAQL